MIYGTDVAKKFGRVFYIVGPNETSFQSIEDVPNYVSQVTIQTMYNIYRKW